MNCQAFGRGPWRARGVRVRIQKDNLGTAKKGGEKKGRRRVEDGRQHGRRGAREWHGSGRANRHLLSTSQISNSSFCFELQILCQTVQTIQTGQTVRSSGSYHVSYFATSLEYVLKYDARACDLQGGESEMWKRGGKGEDGEKGEPTRDTPLWAVAFWSVFIRFEVCTRPWTRHGRR